MKACVIGLGKIGLPLVAQYSSRGIEVIGLDVDEGVVGKLNKGESAVREEPGLEEMIKEGFGKGLIKGTTNPEKAISESDVIVVIVPLIVDREMEPDFRALDDVTSKIGKSLSKGKTVIYETTLPVGTTRNRFKAALEKESGLECEKDFYLAFSPERVNSGTIFRNLKEYPKIVGGIGPESGRKAKEFYEKALEPEVIVVEKPEEAEMVKLCGMVYRDTNIGLANEFARLAAKKGIDITKVIGCANTIPHTHILSPGIGVGGHCAPVYPHFLAKNERELGLEPLVTGGARKINDDMPAFAVGLLEKEMGCVKGKKILLLGLSYRGDVKEISFAPSLDVIRILKGKGADVYVHDPCFSRGEIETAGVAFAENEYAGADAAVLMSLHAQYRKLDAGKMKKSGVKFFLDGRNAFDREMFEKNGIKYTGVGR